MNSIAVMPGVHEDEVWVSVIRMINGVETRTIEVMSPRAFKTLDDAFFVDCGQAYNFDTPTAILGGLTYLNGETVRIMADGVDLGTAVVAAGQVVLDTPVTKAAVGLPYRSTLEPMRVDLNAQGKTTRDTYRKIAEMAISFYNSLDVKYGSTQSALFDSGIAGTDMFTGDVIVNLDGGHDPEAPILITTNGPMPCTVRALVTRVDYVGR